MKHIETYLKNSNTGELLKRCESISDTPIIFPVMYYDINGDIVGEDIEVDGFVEISEKKFKRYKRKYERY